LVGDIRAHHPFPEQVAGNLHRVLLQGKVDPEVLFELQVARASILGIGELGERLVRSPGNDVHGLVTGLSADRDLHPPAVAPASTTARAAHLKSLITTPPIPTVWLQPGPVAPRPGTAGRTGLRIPPHRA